MQSSVFMLAKILNTLKITPAKDLGQVTQFYLISFCSFKMATGVHIWRLVADKTKKDLQLAWNCKLEKLLLLCHLFILQIKSNCNNFYGFKHD